jgi:glycerol-3-phosphate cytidylyltransferase-like family protein
MFKRTIVLVTGGFDPLHEGHIEYFNAAKALAKSYPILYDEEEATSGGYLWVGLNSDEWLSRKKGASFMSFISRHVVISNIRAVDNVIQVNDDDGTSIDAIKQVLSYYPKDTRIVFANGGDRTLGNVPEMKWAAENAPEVIFEFGVGGEEKQNSSSWILKNWNNVQKQNN